MKFQRSFLWVNFVALSLWTSSASAFKVGLVLDKGGKDDKSFNSSAYQGATQAAIDYGIELKYVEATDTNAIESLHRALAAKDFDLIIGVGVAQTDAVKKVATQNPQKKFAIVDGRVDLPNVRSLLFEEQEGSYLVGAIAALKSRTGRIGFIGGMDIPLIRRFALGYEAGSKQAGPQVKVVQNFIGISDEAWANPAKAKELALAQYNAGVDVIFTAAGASNAGVFDAAEEAHRYAIGCDSNQDSIKPGRILTSMLKRVDVAVADTIHAAKDGHFKGGIMRYGLKDKGIDYSVDADNDEILTKDIRQKAEALKAQIISGKIVVPDYYKRGQSKNP